VSIRRNPPHDCLGIRGDQPLDPEQPALVDGMHVRWWPRRSSVSVDGLSFRRETRRSAAAEPQLVAIPTGARECPSRNGDRTLSSATPLTFTDELPRTRRTRSRSAQPDPVRAAHDVETDRLERVSGSARPRGTVRTCADCHFSIGSAPTQRTEQGLVFTVQPVSVVTQASPTRDRTIGRRPAGLEFTSPDADRVSLDVAPRAARRSVDLLFSKRDAIVVRAFEADWYGRRPRQRFDAGVLTATKVTMTGKAIEHVTLESTTPTPRCSTKSAGSGPLAGEPTNEGPPILIDFRLHADSSPESVGRIRA